MARQTNTAHWRSSAHPDVAARRIASFGRHFGMAHLYLAQHAAFPLAVTPELLYQLWANFQRDSRAEMLNIPWIAVADLLLSGLFDEVGHELYEMDVAVRARLLKDLQANESFGQQRIVELSHFLSKYIAHQLESYNPLLRDIATTQQWTALAYASPGEAAHALALALRTCIEQNDAIEQLRIVSLIDAFAEPLADFVPLLAYARGVGYLALGETAQAFAQFKMIGSSSDVAGVRLQVPAKFEPPDTDLLQSSKTSEKLELLLERRVSLHETALSMQSRLDQLRQALLSLETLYGQIKSSSHSTLDTWVSNPPSPLLRQKVESLRNALEPLITRFARSTIHIGVIGRARQGKSSLLQHLSGLGPDVLPAGARGLCTGVRTTLVHDPGGEPYGKVTFYSEREFLRDVIAPYYEILDLGSAPESIAHFLGSPLPPLKSTRRSGRARSAAVYATLTGYQLEISRYASLIGRPPLYVPLPDVRTYIARETLDGQPAYQYRAVRDVRVSCTFPSADVGPIAYIDMPGLGDTGVGDEERVIKTLAGDVDIILFVWMPSPSSGIFPDVDFELYDLLCRTLGDFPLGKSSFAILNRTHTPLRGDNYHSCVRICETVDSTGTHGGSMSFVECMIADCTDEAEVRTVVFEPVLAYLTEHLSTLDVSSLSSWQARLGSLQQDITAELKKMHLMPDSGFFLQRDEYIFEQLFGALWHDLYADIQAREPWYTTHVHVFEEYLRQKVERCRDYTGLPSGAELRARVGSAGSVRTIFSEVQTEMRIYFEDLFIDIDGAFASFMDTVKANVAEIFLGTGKLSDLLQGVSVSMFFDTMTEQDMVSPRLQTVFSALATYESSLRGYFLGHILRELERIDPDTTDIWQALTPENVAQTLKTLYRETVEQLEHTLYGHVYEPAGAARAVVEEFLDQAFTAKGARDDWHIFYAANRAKIWPSEFSDDGESARRKKLWSAWQQQIQSIEKLNGL